MRIGQAVRKTVTVGTGKKQHDVTLTGSVINIPSADEVEVQLPGKQAIVQTWARGECHKVRDYEAAAIIAASTGISKEQTASA